MDAASVTTKENNKEPPGISETHWARFTALGDRIKYVKEKHKRRYIYIYIYIYIYYEPGIGVQSKTI